MGKLKIRECTRCKRGEVYLERDQYGWYECCLQCGYTRDLPDIVPAAHTEWPTAIEREAAPIRKIRVAAVSK
jgi:hypothetical protein